jgi:hypothetical protein
MHGTGSCGSARKTGNDPDVHPDRTGFDATAPGCPLANEAIPLKGGQGPGLVLAMMAALWFGNAVCQGAPERAQPHRVFLNRYCFDCHNTKTKEGGLDLKGLAFDLSDEGTFARWVRVHDRVRDGSMPPEEEPRPPAAETVDFVQFVGSNLHAASAAQQARDGRAPARRLNRAEYQNTLRDLLGVEADYRSMLPEDGSAHGFDKVASALSVSPEHLQAYLAAAKAALEEIIVTGPPPPMVKRQVPQRYREEYFGKPYFRDWVHRFVDAPDAIVRFNDFVDAILGWNGKAKISVTGMYRFRIRAHAWQSEQAVKARIRAGTPGDNASGEPARLIGYTEFPPEGATEEVTVRLHPGQTLRVAPVGIGRLWFDGKRTTAQAYKGPALAMEWVEIEGPLHDSWPPRRHQRLFGQLDFARATRDDAERVVRGFLPRAFRRPVRDEEVERYLHLYDASAAGGGFLAGIKVTLQAALCSPHFLYLRAPAGPLDDHMLAARLSYFLWSSMPDEALLERAATGELCKPEVLRAEVERLLSDPRAAAFTEGFAGQWLDLQKIKATKPDARLYPEFDEVLEWSMVRETERFFDEVLRNDLSLLNFVESDFAILNDRLAAHYGIPGVTGIAFRKVALPSGSVRGGVLTQASVLKVTANGTTTSPVLRGAWVMSRILGKPAPPPPAGVPAVEPDIRGAVNIRDQLARHRSDASCATCHANIDPPGFALESFDVIGGWRERYRATDKTAAGTIEVPLPGTFAPDRMAPQVARIWLGPAVDASGELSDGRTFKSFAGFRSALLADPVQIVRALATKVVTYATGTAEQYADRAALEEIVGRVGEQNNGFRTLVHEVVQSPMFRRQ